MLVLCLECRFVCGAESGRGTTVLISATGFVTMDLRGHLASYIWKWFSLER
jgi:hypothetical protein